MTDDKKALVVKGYEPTGFDDMVKTRYDAKRKAKLLRLLPFLAGEKKAAELVEKKGW